MKRKMLEQYEGMNTEHEFDISNEIRVIYENTKRILFASSIEAVPKSSIGPGQDILLPRLKITIRPIVELLTQEEQNENYRTSIEDQLKKMSAVFRIDQDHPLFDSLSNADQLQTFAQGIIDTFNQLNEEKYLRHPNVPIIDSSQRFISEIGDAFSQYLEKISEK